jgi:hypothetical protein
MFVCEARLPNVRTRILTCETFNDTSGTEKQQSEQTFNPSSRLP